MRKITQDDIEQASLVFFTIAGLILISSKLPQYGLIVSLISQFFWLRSSYKAWKIAGQMGIFVNSILFTIITLYGIINYWLII